MTKKYSPSLRQMLTIPYVILVLLVATTIALLSYFAGREAVKTLSDYALSETVSRITQAVDTHISGSEAVLETAFPTDVPTPASIKADLETLRTRFWLATSIHRDPNNYAYYGDRHGQFIGLYRTSETEAELRLRMDGTSARSIYRYSRIHGALGTPVIEQRIFEPRDRPWYKAGQGSTGQTWTQIYIDFKTLELVSTRAKRVNNSAGEFEGVVATDLSLTLLNDFLQALKLTDNGFAFIVEADGNLVATSRGPHLRKGVDENNTRLNAANSEDPLIAITYEHLLKLTETEQLSDTPGIISFKGPDDGIIHMGYARLRDAAGLDWLIAVAVPREDFMFSVTQNVKRTIGLVLLTCVFTGLIGLTVLNTISRDLKKLSVASKALADGKQDSGIPVERKDVIGDLARSFAFMKERLLTDRLTGIPNREAAVRHIEDKIIHHRRERNSRPFAVVFVDLNGFKQINDRFGHEVGDNVLTELAQRLSNHLDGINFAARFGGDEFIVVLDQVSNHKAAVAIVTQLQREFARPLHTLVKLGPQATGVLTGAAMGIALCPHNGNDTDTLIKFADKDMYRQKHIGDVGTNV